jgi:isopentenyl-diphosphate Delta-isomerase
MRDLVVLVDENDNEIGYLDKLEAHRKGMLHRAFSVLIFNSAGELLLQKRAEGKYHSAGLWTNTCCSHPMPNEEATTAAQRRLREEMGLTCKTNFLYKFLYRTPLDNNLIEHELDYVFTGTCDQQPIIDSHEVADWKFISLADLQKDVTLHPDQYTFWFKEIIKHPAFLEFVPA